MSEDYVNIIEEAMQLGRLQVEQSLMQYPASSRDADIAALKSRARIFGGALPTKSYAEMQQKVQRQQHGAARLQTAHNRALRRLAKASSDLADLKRIVETYGAYGSPLHRMYLCWCAQAGAPTPESRAARRRESLLRALVGRPLWDICDRDFGRVIQTDRDTTRLEYFT